MKKIIVFLTFLIVPQITFAQVNYIKYRDYLIPILGNDTENPTEPLPPAPLDLAQHINQTVNNLLSNASSPAAAIDLYSQRNNLNTVLIRNNSAWTNPFTQQLTCIPSLRGNNPSFLRGATLITPRHVIFAAHVPVTGTITFTGANNEAYQASIETSISHPDFSFTEIPQHPDFGIALLTEDVPASITPCVVANDDFLDFFQDPLGPLPILRISQEQHATVGNLIRFEQPFGNDRERISFNSIVTSDFNDLWVPYFEQPVGGDSGGAIMALIQDQTVLVGQTSTPGTGISLPFFINDIDDLIDQVDTAAGVNTGYAVETVDLSRFIRYQ